MPYKITNVSLDPAYELKRRQASRLQMEPVIAGGRLLLRQSRILTDEQYAANTDWLAENVRNGVLKVEKVDGEGKVTDEKPVTPEPPKVHQEPPPDLTEPPPPVVPEPPVELPPAPPAPPPPLLPTVVTPAGPPPSTEATTQPLPNVAGRKDNKKQGR